MHFTGSCREFCRWEKDLKKKKKSPLFCGYVKVIASISAFWFFSKAAVLTHWAPFSVPYKSTRHLVCRKALKLLCAVVFWSSSSLPNLPLVPDLLLATPSALLAARLQHLARQTIPSCEHLYQYNAIQDSSAAINSTAHC